MTERRVEIEQVYLRDIGGLNIGVPKAVVAGETYYAAVPDGTEGLDESSEFSNRANFFDEKVDGISIKGPVVDLSAAMRRRELVFLDGDDGVWIEVMKEYSSQERRPENG